MHHLRHEEFRAAEHIMHREIHTARMLRRCTFIPTYHILRRALLVRPIGRRVIVPLAFATPLTEIMIIYDAPRGIFRLANDLDPAPCLQNHDIVVLPEYVETTFQDPVTRQIRLYYADSYCRICGQYFFIESTAPPPVVTAPPPVVTAPVVTGPPPGAYAPPPGAYPPSGAYPPPPGASTALPPGASTSLPPGAYPPSGAYAPPPGASTSLPSGAYAPPPGASTSLPPGATAPPPVAGAKFCTSCGTALRPGDKFCPVCGHQT